MALDNRKGPKANDFSPSFLFDFVGKDNKVYQFSSFFFLFFALWRHKFFPFFKFIYLLYELFDHIKIIGKNTKNTFEFVTNY